MFRSRDRLVKILVWAVVISMLLTVVATVASLFT